jgi:hypothetical protein
MGPCCCVSVPHVLTHRRRKLSAHRSPSEEQGALDGGISIPSSAAARGTRRSVPAPHSLATPAPPRGKECVVRKSRHLVSIRWTVRWTKRCRRLLAPPRSTESSAEEDEASTTLGVLQRAASRGEEATWTHGCTSNASDASCCERLSLSLRRSITCEASIPHRGICSAPLHPPASNWCFDHMTPLHPVLRCPTGKLSLPHHHPSAELSAPTDSIRDSCTHHVANTLD